MSKHEISFLLFKVVLLKQNSLSIPRNLALGTFGELLTVFSSASDKAKLFAKNFSKNSNLDDSDDL